MELNFNAGGAWVSRNKINRKSINTDKHYAKI